MNTVSASFLFVHSPTADGANAAKAFPLAHLKRYFHFLLFYGYVIIARYVWLQERAGELTLAIYSLFLPADQYCTLTFCLPASSLIAGSETTPAASTTQLFTVGPTLTI